VDLPRDVLAGIRVVDLTRFLAGAGGTRILADFGAEVIRVEWRMYPALDFVRFMPPYAPNAEGEEEAGINRSGFFNNINADKLGVTLNIAEPAGKEILRRLIKTADVVAESYSAGVMKRWGFGYEDLKQLRPDIIYVAQSGFGHSGPYQNYRTYGPTAQAFAGLTLMSGLPGEAPAGWGYSYMDHIAGWFGAIAALQALHHRRRTGEGQFIDLAQAQAGCTITGPFTLDYTVNGRPYRRPGNPPGNRADHPLTAPHNTYRCAGKDPLDQDEWVAIACFSDAEWEGLVTAMDAPEWAREERFQTLLGRLQHQDALDAHIAEWTATQEKHAVAERLQAAGVPAGAVQSAQDRLENDPQLAARGLYVELEHAEQGRRLFENVPVHLSATPGRLRRPAPLIGEHNDYVFRELLGMSDAEVDQLSAADVI
jgi:crotonobetainyl-CoA:carnitine CoA-transferase CaiB-like acyl-CoA transferase